MKKKIVAPVYPKFIGPDGAGVTAVQAELDYEGRKALGRFCNRIVQKTFSNQGTFVSTPEGDVQVNTGDWVIKTGDGFRVEGDPVFREHYEEVTAE